MSFEFSLRWVFEVCPEIGHFFLLKEREKQKKEEEGLKQCSTRTFTSLALHNHCGEGDELAGLLSLLFPQRNILSET